MSPMMTGRSGSRDDIPSLAIGEGMTPTMRNRGLLDGGDEAAGVVDMSTSPTSMMPPALPDGEPDPFDYPATVNALTVQFLSEHEETRVAALKWLLMLHKKAPRKVCVSACARGGGVGSVGFVCVDTLHGRWDVPRSSQDAI